MDPIKAAAAVAVLAVALFIAWQTIGSAARQAAVTQPEIEAQQAEPTSRPTFTPRPTLTPLPTRVQDVLHQVTTAEELAGVWAYSRGSIGNEYYQFNQDGTWISAPTQERLASSPGLIGEFWFEGTRLNLNVTEDISVVGCEGVVGVYQVQLLENGAFRLELVEDPCEGRSKQLTAKNFEPVELTE